jgi:hypothetical protein
VKAQGTDNEVKGGGFWSTSYYISRAEEDASASQSSSSLTSTSSAVTTPTPDPSPTSASMSSPTPTSVLTRTPIVSSLKQTPSPTQEAADQATRSPPPSASSSVSKGAIVGLAVGLSLALIVIAAGALLLFCRRKRNIANRSGVHQTELPATTDLHGHKVSKGTEYTNVQHEVYVQPSEMQGSRTFFELPAGKNSPRV